MKRDTNRGVPDIMDAMFNQPARPAPGAGQIWALTQAAGAPNPAVCLTAPLGGGRFEAMKLAEAGDERMAAELDLILTEEQSGLAYPAMVETWNRAEVTADKLSHCVGALDPAALESVRRLSASQKPSIGRVGPPVRYPGDPRIDFQDRERAALSHLAPIRAIKVEVKNTESQFGMRQTKEWIISVGDDFKDFVESLVELPFFIPVPVMATRGAKPSNLKCVRKKFVWDGVHGVINVEQVRGNKMCISFLLRKGNVVLKGIRVSIGMKSKRTDADGRCKFNIEIGKYPVKIMLPNILKYYLNLKRR